MKLFCVFAAIVALAVASEIEIPDSEAVASEIESRESSENLEASASAYSYVPQNNYVPPQNNYVPPQNNYVPPQNNYVPPQNNYVPPQNNYVPPQNNYVPPQNNYVPPQNNYYPPNVNYPPVKPPAPSSTTTPIPVIKNELIYGDNGSYQYEYQIGDGTHVGEQGYFLNPKTEDESIVKKGWYSYNGPDGKVYTVTWWADHTGFHASGDHLPTPPPIPPAIQAAIEQNAKEEAANQANQKPQTQPTYTDKPYWQATEKPYYPTQPAYYPTQPTYYPAQPAYNPNQPIYYPGQTYPSQQYPKPGYSSYGKADLL